MTIEEVRFEKLDATPRHATPRHATLRGWAADRELSGTVLLTRRGDTIFNGCYGPGGPDFGGAGLATAEVRPGLRHAQRLRAHPGHPTQASRFEYDHTM